MKTTKLSDPESALLTAIGLRGDAGVRELAEIAGLTLGTCRRVLESLFARGAVSRRIVVNPFKIGLSIHSLWFSLNPGSAKRRGEIERFIVSSSAGYFGEFEGDFTYKIDIFSRSIRDLDIWQQAVTAKFGDVFSKRMFGSSLEINDYAHKLLAPKQSNSAPLVKGPCDDVIDLKAEEREVLQALGHINQESHASLARRLRIAPATFEYRVKRLRERGVIVGYQVVAEPERLRAMGLSMSVHRIRLRRLDGNTRKKVTMFCEKDMSVYGLTHAVGAVDVEICSSGVGPRASKEFLARFEDSFGPIIAEISSVAVLKHHKNTNFQ